MAPSKRLPPVSTGVADTIAAVATQRKKIINEAITIVNNQSVVDDLTFKRLHSGTKIKTIKTEHKKYTQFTKR